jgi:hypothetical protein
VWRRRRLIKAEGSFVTCRPNRGCGAARDAARLGWDTVPSPIASEVGDDKGSPPFGDCGREGAERVAGPQAGLEVEVELKPRMCGAER